MTTSHPLAASNVQRYVMAICFRILEDWHLAEDCRQDVLLRALEQWESFDQSRPVFPWIRAIAFWMAVNLKRRRGRHVDLLKSRAVDMQRPPEPQPDERATADDEIRRVVETAAAKSQKPSVTRHILRRRIESATLVEIGKEVGMTCQGVHLHLRKAAGAFR